jgi:predicted secreted protein
VAGKFLSQATFASATLAVFRIEVALKMSRQLSFFRQFPGRPFGVPLLLLPALFLSSTLLSAKTVTLSVTDNNTTICLIEGDTLVITLPSPIADSYRWQKQQSKSSPLSGLKDDYTPPKDPKSSGVQTFRFNAATVGKTGLLLNFERQKPGPAPLVTQTFSISVTVASGEPASMVLIGTYKGTTACADCTAIQTDLRLYAKGRSDFTDCLYISTRTYLGGRNGDQSFTDRGAWSMLKGDAVDPNATVYELSPDQPQQAQYFLLQAGGATLTELDQQMRPSTAPAMYTLTLKRVQ